MVNTQSSDCLTHWSHGKRLVLLLAGGVRVRSRARDRPPSPACRPALPFFLGGLGMVIDARGARCQHGINGVRGTGRSRNAQVRSSPNVECSLAGPGHSSGWLQERQRRGRLLSAGRTCLPAKSIACARRFVPNLHQPLSAKNLQTSRAPRQGRVALHTLKPAQCFGHRLCAY